MTKLILASASKSRRDLLTGAGLDIEIVVSDLDEDTLKQQGLSVKETALALAVEKARIVSENSRTVW